jgi:hypothetical protein
VIVIRDNSSLATDTSSITLSSHCSLTSCSFNQYLGEDGKCTSCPFGTISPRGSTSIQNCASCIADGLEREHSKYPACNLPSAYDPDLSVASEWRLLTHTSLTKAGWRWDVDNINLYSNESCSNSSKVNTTVGIPINSASAAGWGPERAFDNRDSAWGGRQDNRSLFWIGISFPSSVIIKCITFTQTVETVASELHVQARENNSPNWQNVWVSKALVSGFNEIKMIPNPTPMPTSMPTSKPTSNPTTKPISTCGKFCPNSRQRYYHRRIGSLCKERCFYVAFIASISGFKCGSCS